MYLLSLLLLMILSIFCMFCVMNGNITYYLDPTSLLLIILITIPVLISAGLFRDFNNAFRLSAKRSTDCSRRELERAVEAVSLTIKTLWASGIFNVLFSFIHSLATNYDTVEMLPPYISVSLIPLLYSAFFVILLLPMQSRLKLRLCELSGQPETDPK